jgi:hypothetical protein
MPTHTAVSRVAWMSLLLVAFLARPGQAEAAGVQLLAFGSEGAPSRVKVYQQGLAFGTLVADFEPFPGFTGGVRVAVADVDGDSLEDVIVAPGPGGGPHVLVFAGTCSVPLSVLPPIPGSPPSPPFCAGERGVDTSAPIASFFAFNASFNGGLYVTAGNFDASNDPVPCVRNEIVVGAGAGGGPHVVILRNATTGGSCPLDSPVAINPQAPLTSFFPYPSGFTGGVRVAATEFNLDGVADLITGAGPGGGAHVQVFRGLPGGGVATSPVVSTILFPGFTGGVFVTAAKLAFVSTSAGADLVVSADAGGGPHVLVFLNTTSLGGAISFDFASPLVSFFAYELDFAGGVRVGPLSFNGLMVAPGPGRPGTVRAYTTPVLIFGAIPTVKETLGVAMPFDDSMNGVNLGQ